MQYRGSVIVGKMESLWTCLMLLVFGINISANQIKQTRQIDYVRILKYNVSSKSYTSSLHMKTTGHKIQQCFVQCHHTPNCLSLLYNSETTDCVMFSGVLLDRPLEFSNSLVKAYFIAGASLCHRFGYIDDVRVPFCYKVHDDVAKFEDARSNCEHEGGRLIQIDSPVKQQVMETIPSAGSGGKYRIDGITVNNTWIFSSGLDILRMYWYHTQPDIESKQTRCLSINTYFNNQWDDVYCDNFFGYICERIL